MTNMQDIAIIGGGLNGCTLAIALAENGFSVTLIDALKNEAQTSSEFDGRSYALALASKNLLHAIGVWDQIADHSQPMLEIKVTDGRAGQGPSPWMMHFDHAEIEEGPMGYMMEDRHLRRALLKRIGTLDQITHLDGVTVNAHSIRQSHVHLSVPGRDTINARLIIAADGRRGDTAARAGIKKMAWGYDQSALVCAIEHEKPHGGIAHQFFMPAGPLAILPLPGNRSSIVWSETTETAAQIQAMEDDAYLEMLRPRFGDFLGQIKLAGIRYSYPLGLSLAQSMVAERLALIGDAAHGVHPIAGQGLNAGLKDVAALVEVLVGARRRGADIGSDVVLGDYQRWRRFDVASLAMATDGFNRLFSNDNSLLRLGRDLGMGLVNALPGLRRSFIREAAGLTGDMPKLMQGKPI
jgi:2-octaprenyl-6-methoxyphenol hydroxylase